MCEKFKFAFLNRVADQIFVPKFIWMKKKKGIRHKELGILFLGYIFIKTDFSKKLEKELEVFVSFARPVRIGGGFYPIREEEELFLYQMMEGGTVIPFSIGYLVDGELKVLRGPLQNYTKKVYRIDRHNRLAEMKLNLWGEERSIRIGLEVKAKITGEEYEEMLREA